MIGVTVTTTATGSTAAADTSDAATYFVPVLAQRGPTDAPVVCRSYADIERIFGTEQTYSWLHAEARTYFTEADGAGQMVVQRVVGAAAVTAGLTLADRTSGSGASTLRINASSPGAWASDVSVEIVNGLLPNTVDVHIYLAGYADPVEEFQSLPTVSAVVQALAVSDYVRAVDLGSTAATDALRLPKATLPTGLSTDGNDDRGSVGAAALIAALDNFTEDYGPGIVAVPGQLYSTVASALAAHCKLTRRSGVVIPAQGTTVSGAASAARSLRTLPGAERLLFAYPWVLAPDGAGGSRVIPPTGFVAGRRANTIAQSGPWDAPAGDRGLAKYIIGAEVNLTRDDVNTLDADAVSPIRMTANGPKLYSYRSLSADIVNWQFLTYIDTMNLLAWEVDQALEQYVNVTVDGLGHTYARIATTVEGILARVADAGGLYARRDPITRDVLDVGFVVRVDDASLNPAAQVALGRINVYAAARLSPLAKEINVTLAKVTLTTAL